MNYHSLRLLRVVPPVLQALVTLAVRVLLRLLFLRQVPLAVRNHLAHVIDVVLVVLGGILLGVLFQDGDDLAPGFVSGSAKCTGLASFAFSFPFFAFSLSLEVRT